MPTNQSKWHAHSAADYGAYRARYSSARCRLFLLQLGLQRVVPQQRQCVGRNIWFVLSAIVMSLPIFHTFIVNTNVLPRRVAVVVASSYGMQRPCRLISVSTFTSRRGYIHNNHVLTWHIYIAHMCMCVFTLERLFNIILFCKAQSICHSTRIARSHPPTPCFHAFMHICWSWLSTRSFFVVITLIIGSTR